MKTIFGASTESAPTAQAEEGHPDLPSDVAAAQDFAQLKNSMKRHMERMAAYMGWVKPDEIALRYERFEKEAADALAAGKRASREFGYIEPPDPLPREMQGQSASTIQAMLRQGKEANLWKT